MRDLLQELAGAGLFGVEEAPSQEFFAHPKEARTREFLQKISHTEA